MSLFKLLVGITILGFFGPWGNGGASAAEAPNPPAVGTSTQSADSWPNSWKDRLEVSVFTNYHGPRIKDPGASMPLTYFDSDLTASYYLNGSQGLGLYVPFFYSPLKSQPFDLGDVGLKLFDKKAVSGNGLTVVTNLYVQAPTNAGSQARHMVLGLKATPYFRYSIPGSRFKLGAWTEAKEYFGVTNDKTLKLWALPYLEYALSGSMGLSVGYEMEWHHDVGMAAPLEVRTFLTDIQTGIVWSISKNLLVNPYIQFFTTNNATIDSTTVGALISAKLI